jgi:arylsulfatase A-like enzyme
MSRFAVSRRQFLAAPFLAPAALAGQRGGGRNPNVVVLLADDQGWGDLSIHGNTNLATPEIDSLGRDGALFDRFFVCAVCAPTRAEFLTGRYHARGGVRGVSTGAERLNLDETTIAQVFQAAGYRTGAFGKWHNGTQHPYHPNARGFDEYYGFTSGHWGEYFDPELDHNGRLVRGKGYITDDLTSHALDFIEQSRGRPFFCYLPFNTPHSPMQVPDRFYEKFAGAGLKLRNREPEREDTAMTRAALAMVENIDWNVGRVLRKLEELKLANDTIVVYFSDNGPNSWRWNGGMKGRKGSVDEGGLRSPLLIRWPGHIRAGARIPQIAAAIDLLPTLAHMAGVPVTVKKPLDGVNLQPLLSGAEANWPDRMIFSLQRRQVSARTQRHRLDAEGRLFDMVEDPGQDRDVSTEKPEVAARLRAAAGAWSREVLPLVGPDDRPFPVGHAPATLLPARDGVPGGGVERSASAPNCSFFTNWRTPDGFMIWDIEVAQSGAYEAEMFYTCAASDVGSAVELSFLESRIEARIGRPHDPPLRGAAQDRVSRRGESYVKDFQPLKLGVIRLKEGRGKLTLRALKVPGARVADVRYIRLTRN